MIKTEDLQNLGFKIKNQELISGGVDFNHSAENFKFLVHLENGEAKILFPSHSKKSSSTLPI